MSAESKPASHEEMKEHARRDVESYLCRPFFEWDDWTWAWLSTSEPYKLEEALNMVQAVNHREAAGAIAMIAHRSGSECRHSDPDKAAQYAAIVDKAVSGTAS